MQFTCPTLTLALLFKLGIEFWTCFLKVGLRYIEDRIDLQFWVHIVLLSLLLAQLFVVIVFDPFLGLRVDTAKGRNKDWEALLPFLYRYLWTCLTIAILDLLLGSLLVLGEVQSRDSVEGAEYWQIVVILLTMKH